MNRPMPAFGVRQNMPGLPQELGIVEKRAPKKEKLRLRQNSGRFVALSGIACMLVFVIIYNIESGYQHDQLGLSFLP